MPETDEAFISLSKDDGFAYEILSLEHRRWCCYMASAGWKAGKRDIDRKQNPCLVTQEVLAESIPELVKYDLMPMLMMQIDDMDNK